MSFSVSLSLSSNPIQLINGCESSIATSSSSNVLEIKRGRQIDQRKIAAAGGITKLMGQLLPAMAVVLITMWLLLLTTIPAANSVNQDDAGCLLSPVAQQQPDLVTIVASKDEADLRVVVPNITSLRQFVDCSDLSRISGYCIALFEAALVSIVRNGSLAIAGGYNSRPLRVHYTCFNFTQRPNATSNSSSLLTYDDMVQAVADNHYDAVVGDVTIGASRMSKIDFTQKYMESGIVIVMKQRESQTLNSWTLFLCPFTAQVWYFALGAFIFTAIAVCVIEYTRHLEFQQDSVLKRMERIFWFILEVMILFRRESIRSSIGHLIMVTWVFIVLLFGAIYTAGLTSFLTTSSLSPTKIDITSLKVSGQQIGYRKGSIVKDFLKTRFQIPEAQLLPIRPTQDFLGNLTNGVPVVDELPYVNVILSALSSLQCNFEVSNSFTNEGFGFGFNKETKLANTFSIAMLNLIEDGCIQYIEDKYNMSAKFSCPSTPLQFTPITFQSSLILFIPLFSTIALCILISMARNLFVRHLEFGRNRRIRTLIDDPISVHGENDMAHMIRRRNQSNIIHPDVYG